MTIPDDIRTLANEIAARHAIGPRPVLYLLHGLKLRTEVVEMFASMADWGYPDGRIIEAAEALAEDASCRVDARRLVDAIMWQIVALGWEARIADTPDPYERDDWYDAEARRAGKRRWTQLSPSDYVQTRAATRQEAAVQLLERVRQKNAARARLEAQE